MKICGKGQPRRMNGTWQEKGEQVGWGVGVGGAGGHRLRKGTGWGTGHRW